MNGLSLPPLNIPALLRQYNLHPSKGLGQNFLQDNAALQKIVSAAELGPSEAVLEIGPGLGQPDPLPGALGAFSHRCRTGP